MKINAEVISKLNPDPLLFDNYLTHHKDFSGTLEDFILLDNISYTDKVWVFASLANKIQSITWAILCASKVLPIFEKKYPNDKRPRQALDTAKNYLKNPGLKNISSGTATAAQAASDRAFAEDNISAGAAAFACAAAAYAASAYSLANKANVDKANASANFCINLVGKYSSSIDTINDNAEFNLVLMLDAIKVVQ